MAIAVLVFDVTFDESTRRTMSSAFDSDPSPSQVSVYDRDGLDGLRRETRVDPQQFRRFRIALLKHFRPDSESIDELPPSLRPRIALHSLALIERHDSTIDGATKLLLRAASGLRLETVLLRAATGRTSICVSSQIGCAAACQFCATGKMGIARNLAAAEILDQVLIAGQLAAIERRRIRNVVFMGMGEPLHNEANLYETLEVLTAPESFAMAPTRILVSTVGIPTAMRRLAERFPAVRIALSLHSVRPDLRASLIPLARQYSLDSLRQVLVDVNGRSSVPIMLEYLLLASQNDSPQDADDLIEWTRDLNVHVNLIPFNPIAAAPRLAGSDRPTREAFAARLKAAGILTTLRYSLGQDIAAACGQLAQRPPSPRPSVNHPANL